MMLYKFGVIEAEKNGLILVDTKYEFGYSPDGQIMLMDEVHTCDSSNIGSGIHMKNVLITVKNLKNMIRILSVTG